jgi:hypothetical protein
VLVAAALSWARPLVHLRGAWSFARYTAERFQQTVEVEALAGRASIDDKGASEAKPAAEPKAQRPEPSARQIPLFAD